MTSLSSTQELEKTIKSLNSNLTRSQMLEATQLIGKEVQIPTGFSPLVEGKD